MKLFCECCDWNGSDDQVLRAESPFSKDSVTIIGCPKCRSVEYFTVACDEPECWRPASCGTPTPSGYRSTCFEHRSAPSLLPSRSNAMSNVAKQILFDMRVSRILGEATEIAGDANLLSRMRSPDLMTSQYDLRTSARNLREAADKLDSINNRK